MVIVTIRLRSGQAQLRAGSFDRLRAGSFDRLRTSFFTLPRFAIGDFI